MTLPALDPNRWMMSSISISIFFFVAVTTAAGCGTTAQAAAPAMELPGSGWVEARARLADGRTFVVASTGQPEVAAGRTWPAGPADYQAMGFHPPAIAFGIVAGDRVRPLRDTWVSIFGRTGSIEDIEERSLELSECVAWPRPVARRISLGAIDGLFVGVVCREADGRETEITVLLAAQAPLRRILIGPGIVSWSRGACRVEATPELEVDLEQSEIALFHRVRPRWTGGSTTMEDRMDRDECMDEVHADQMIQEIGFDDDWMLLRTP